MLTFSPKKMLRISSFTNFIYTTLGTLPLTPARPLRAPYYDQFGEILLDVVWALDVYIDEIHQEAKLVVANAEQGKMPTVAEGQDPADVIARAAKVKQDAEEDKKTLAIVVRTFAVRVCRCVGGLDQPHISTVDGRFRGEHMQRATRASSRAAVRAHSR